MKKITIFLIFLILIHSQVFAQDPIGIDLLRGCNSIIKQAEGKEITVEESFDAAFWMGFFTGFNDSTTITHTLTKSFPYYTPAEGVQTEQVALIVQKYLKEHPEILHESARMCFFSAMTEAFPYKR